MPPNAHSSAPQQPGQSGDPAEKTKDFLQKAPTVSLPKGGGAISGIGEKFAANPVTGTSSLSVPLGLSPGRSGAGPEIGLSYDSGSGNGPFGLGWHLGVASIKRKTDKGLPRYWDFEDSDVFVFSEAEDLVPAQKLVGDTWVDDTSTPEGYRVRRYRPRVEAAFARIERWTSTSTGVVHWRTTARDNTLRKYGVSAGARVADPADDKRVFEWLLEETRDEVGNVTTYEYKAADRVGVNDTDAGEGARAVAYAHLKRVKYGNATPFTASGFKFEVVFDYGEHTADPPTPDDSATPWPVRQDCFSSFRSRFDVRCYRLCRRVLMFHRIDDLSEDPVLVRSTEFTYAEDPKFTKLLSVQSRGWDTTGEEVATETIPAVEFTYSEPRIDDTIRFVEGMDDLPGGLDTGRFQWVDLDGEGLTGLLSEQAGSWFYKRSLGADGLAPLVKLGSRPNFDLRGPGNRLVDIDGDGALDFVHMGPPIAGFGRRNGDEWGFFQKFESVPNFGLDGPNTKMADLTGDGHADVFIAKDNEFWLIPSRGAKGYGDIVRIAKPENDDDGPRIVFSSRSELIAFADMTGDGLPDIVRVRNNGVSYYPNKGYGEFGAKVLMEGSPFFDHEFEPSRVRLNDVDGSGTTDLIYLGSDGPRLWFNRSGNSLSDAVALTFPSTGNHATIDVADIEGSGTACLVWSSPLMSDLSRPLRFLRLMADGKPHLLTKVVNNLGRETTLTYTPSTKFYLDDRAAGTPWVTRLPFPVQCLTKVEHVDHVTGWSFTQTSTYHHGYFDGAEREFRGFGLVETRDAEKVPNPTAENSEAEFHQPPALTRTWFHIGAEDIEAKYAAGYWSGDVDAARLPKNTREGNLRYEDQCQAPRALKGKPLRVETYAEDGTADSGNPYNVVESRYAVKCLQPSNARANAVFRVDSREAMTFEYERVSTDPRIKHALTLDVDDFGNVLKSAAVSYPRRDVEGRTTQQEALLVVVTEASFINDVTSADHYHVGLPYETASYELTGASYVEAPPTTPRTARSPPNVAEVLADVTGAGALDFEDAPTSGLQLRLLGRDRVLYWKDDLTGPADVYTIESRALVYEKYRQAFTSGLISAVHGTDVTSGILTDEGGYVEDAFLGEESDGNYWIRSGTATLDDDHFFNPTAFTDVFGNVTTVTWDTHDLFVVAVEAPLTTGAVAADGLTTTADIDYRVLQPFRVTDPNGTKNEAAFDPLGRVVKTAVVGREGEGDVLASSPGTIITYEMTRWSTSELPNRVHVQAREAHGGSTFLETWVYSDGSGHEVMTKIEAAPGPVPGETGTIDPRYIGTGRTVVDNKGNVVKQYEPYFSATNAFEDEDDIVETGVTPIMKYDPIGRNIQTTLPNNTFRQVVFTPWRVETWDENDTVLLDPVPPYGTFDGDSWHDQRGSKYDPEPSDEEQRAATLTEAHAATPSVAHLDALGRTYQTDEMPDDETTYSTVITLDVSGNPTVLTDARSIETQSQTFDMLGRPMKTESPDAGDTRVFIDAAGQPCRTWKAGSLSMRQQYDEMRRPTQLWVDEGTERLVQITVYGEVLPTEDAEDGYLLGKPYRVYDTAGCVTSTANDFKGNPLSANRRVLVELDDEVDWSAADAETDPADIETAIGALLETEEWTSTGTFDALNRPVTATKPDGTVTTFGYDVGGKLVSVDTDGFDVETDVVTSITYNSKGQRESITYGNGLTTTYTYDPLTFRLATLVTNDGTDDLQNLTYTYDPVGNIVQVTDAAQQTLYFDNTEVTPTQTYEYDALYRLIQGTGRENTALSQVGYGDPTYGDIPHGTTACRAYVESYEYDEVGNISKMGRFSGTSSPGNWTRGYHYATGSNRLLKTSAPGDDVEDPGDYSHSYGYSARGAMTTMPHLAAITLDFRDQMRAVDLGSGDDAVYHYDAGGQRVRKIVRRGANREETLYLGGFEVYRKFVSGVQKNERMTAHVMDDTRRVLMIETATKDDDGDAITTPEPRFRFQLDNHLGTACVEVDEAGSLVSYEEYHPFGSTSWHARDSAIEVSAKRYRYTGKEKDDETGLYYHGARHMAAWLGRWCSADPSGVKDGVNRYAYVRGNPIRLMDPTGRDSTGGMVGGTVGTVILADLLTPEPTDVLLPKWVGYGIALGVLGLVAAGEYLNDQSGNQISMAPKPVPAPTDLVDQEADADPDFQPDTDTVGSPIFDAPTDPSYDAPVDLATQRDAHGNEWTQRDGGRWQKTSHVAGAPGGIGDISMGAPTGGGGVGSGKSGSVTGDPGVIAKKLEEARSDLSKAAEIRVGKMLSEQEGLDVHFIAEDKRLKTADMRAGGRLTDVKRIGSFANFARQLNNGVQQVGPGGQIIVVRPADAKESLAQYRDFASKFKPRDSNGAPVLGVDIRVVDEDTLPPLHTW